MGKPWTILTLAVITVCTLAFAACGDDDDDGAGDDTTRRPTATRTAGADDDDDGNQDDGDDPDNGSDDGGNGPDATGADDETSAADDDDDNGSSGGDAQDGGANGGGGGDDDDNDDPTPTRSPNARVCLVTVAEVSDAIGEDVRLDSSDDGCTFITDDFETVHVVASDLGDDAEEAFQTGFGVLGGEEVDGIGDDAFWLEGFNQLNVRDGDQHLIVTLVFSDTASARSAGLEIAEAALTRID
jgi:hypothetical protein